MPAWAKSSRPRSVVGSQSCATYFSKKEPSAYLERSKPSKLVPRSRAICSEHLVQITCVECAAKQQQAVGVVSQRTRYYGSSGYHPVWWASHDSYWDDDDYRWYDEGGGHDFDDDIGGGNFEDS